MAKARQEEITQNSYDAKALVYIKYDKEKYKPGEEFQVRGSDAQDIGEHGYIELLEELPKEEETPKGGE